MFMHNGTVNARHLDADIDAVENRIADLEISLTESGRYCEIYWPDGKKRVRSRVRSGSNQWPDSSESGSSKPARVRHDSPAADKIALFRSLFVGRADVYASRWTSSKTGKSGWSPAVRGGYYTDGVTAADLLPLSDEVIEQHLVGSRTGGEGLHAGLYPMLRDDACRLLVCDFDDGT